MAANIFLYMPTSSVSDASRITALVDLGLRELNRRTVIVPLRAVQSLAGLPGGATSPELRLHDIWSAQTLAAAVSPRLPCQIESWQQANAQRVPALNAQLVSTGVIRAVVLIVVVLGIACVRVVSAVQKRRIVVLQGTINGAIGSALGVVLALALIWAFSRLALGGDGLPLFATSGGLQDAIDKRPGELPGGMQQRVEIARALVVEPPRVLADEPTGNFDTQLVNEVFDVMHRMHPAPKISILPVTHDPCLAARCDRVIERVDGRIDCGDAVAAARKPEPADARAR